MFNKAVKNDQKIATGQILLRCASSSIPIMLKEVLLYTWIYLLSAKDFFQY